MKHDPDLLPVQILQGTEIIIFLLVLYQEYPLGMPGEVQVCQVYLLDFAAYPSSPDLKIHSLLLLVLMLFIRQ